MGSFALIPSVFRQTLIGFSRVRSLGVITLSAFALGAFPPPVAALETLDFQVIGGNKNLEKIAKGASALSAQVQDKELNPDDLFSAARADYARILSALYAAGHYAVSINIIIDGREAAGIAPLEAPDQIKIIKVLVDPGPAFKFSRTQITPLAPNTELPDEFAPGEIAGAGTIETAARSAILAWREASHAKVETTRQDVIANHPSRSISADIRLDPGPALRFGPVTVTGAQRMDIRRLIKIAGIPEGEAFSQSELDDAANRLRRSGVFASVALSESDQILQGDLLPIEIKVTEQKTRRLSIGTEFATHDGISLSGFWLHRNLLGGAERLRVDAEVTNIAAGDSGVDYNLGVTIDRPATFSRDTTASVKAEIGHLDEVDYAMDYAIAGFGVTHYYSDELTLKAGIDYEYATGSDPAGDFIYRNLSLPLNAIWERRDTPTDARDGFYIDGTVKPFQGFGTTGSGARFSFDARGYESFGTDQAYTLAARLQGGVIIGASLRDVPRADLFYSGGGGTVRGQPYRSLGIPQLAQTGDDFIMGGSEILAASLELRARITKSIGVVGFYDYGAIGEGTYSLSENDHAGAGIGLRYETGLGPIRLDIATPVSGHTGDGVQIYIGLGQAF